MPDETTPGRPTPARRWVDRAPVGEVSLPAKSRTALRLLVHVPEEHRRQAFQIAVRQLWEREEVGRVTWQLRSKRAAKATM